MLVSLRRWIARAAVCGFIGLVLPMALIGQADAFVDPSTLQATRVVAAGTALEEAGAVATKLAPLRMMTSVTPVGAVINLVAAGALWWLTSTDSGHAVASEAWGWVSGQFGDKQNYEAVGTPALVSNSWCTNTPALAGGVWTAASVAVTITSHTETYGASAGVDCAPRATGNYKFSCISTVTYSGTNAGTVALGNSGSAPAPGTTVMPACANLAAAGKYLPIALDFYGGTTAERLIAMHFVNPSPPVVNNKAGAESATVMMMEKDCKNSSTGATTVVVATGAAGTSNIPSVGCPAGTYPTAQRIYSEVCLSTTSCAGKRLLNSTSIAASAAAQYPLCIGPGAAGCTMRVQIDGTNCDYGLVGCANWWELYKTQPERVKCLWGTYNLPVVTDCGALRHAYVTEYGATTDPQRSPYEMPVPATTTTGQPWPEGVPFPGEDPAPDPSSTTSPSTGTGTEQGPVTNPAPKSGSDPRPSLPGQESDPANCWGGMASWNPVDWVFTPVKCSLEWAFIPSPAVQTAVADQFSAAVSDSSVGAWSNALGAYPAAFTTGPGGSCEGPAMALGFPFHQTFYPASACEGPSKVLADLCKIGSGALLAVTGGLACVRLVLSGIGYSTGQGGES